MGNDIDTNTSPRPAYLPSAVNGSCQLSPLRPNAAGGPDLIHFRGGTTISASLSNKSSQDGTDIPYLVEPDVSAVAQVENIDEILTTDAFKKVQPLLNMCGDRRHIKHDPTSRSNKVSAACESFWRNH